MSPKKALPADKPISLLATVKAVLVADGWTVGGPQPDDPRLVWRVGSTAGDWPMVALATPDERLVVYSFLPGPVERPVAEVDAVIGRINDGLILGAFEFDVEAQLVKFRTGAGLRGVPVTEAVVREVIYPNVATVKDYLAVFRALADTAQPVAAVSALADAVGA